MKNKKRILQYSFEGIKIIMREDYMLRLERIPSIDGLDHCRLVDEINGETFRHDMTLDELRIELAKEHYPLEEYEE